MGNCKWNGKRGSRLDDNLDNLRRVWDQSDFTDYAEGMLAYSRYNATLTRLAKRYGYPLESVVGAFAALSPNNDYMNNLRSTVSLLRGSERTSRVWCVSPSRTAMPARG
jgi:hypothetical protein